ncbi:MAG TPA: Spy/CpxP family protein refolding chaperone [Gemmatimonadaceae bacterium]|nr:Spy/CpxP family protein refolding chaperone [Gemmatimonadaceae bacterium]
MGKTRVIALAVATLVSAGSFAGAQAPAQQGARHGQHEMQRGMRAGVRAERGLFRGITLSDAEKAKIRDIHTKYAAQAKSLREQMKPAMQEARAARQKGDTAAARAVFAKNKPTFDKLAELRKSEQAEVRSALTPENQKLYDANVQQLAKRRDEMKAGRKDGKAGKRGGFRTQRSGQAG